LLQHEPKTDGSFQFWHTPNEGLLCAAKVKTSEFPVQTRRRSQLAVFEVNNRKRDDIMLVFEELQNIEDRPSHLPEVFRSIESRESDPLQNQRNDWQIR
jgi:hypothetical protein